MMSRVFAGALLTLGVAACAYRPTATEVIRIVDSPADVRACTRLGEVFPPVLTVPGLATATQLMLEQTVALGGTDLFLDRLSQDWSVVRGVAYACDVGRIRRGATVVRTRG